MDAKPQILAVDSRITSLKIPLDGERGPTLWVSVVEPPSTRDDPAGHRRRRIDVQLQRGQHDKRRTEPKRERLGYIEIDVREWMQQ